MPNTQHAAPDPQVLDLPDGRYFRWRFRQALAATTDEIAFVLPKRGSGRAFGPATVTFIAASDIAAPGTTTFTPAVGTEPDFVADTLDERSTAASSDAPSRSQSPLAVDVPRDRIVVRLTPSAPCTADVCLVVREGHRV